MRLFTKTHHTPALLSAACKSGISPGCRIRPIITFTPPTNVGETEKFMALAVIDFRTYGAEMQFVEIGLNRGGSAVSGLAGPLSHKYGNMAG